MNKSHKIKEMIQNFFMKNSRQRWFHASFLILAAVVMLITSYAMIHPVITLDRDTGNNLPGLYTEGAGKASGEQNDAAEKNSADDASSKNKEASEEDKSAGTGKGEKSAPSDKDKVRAFSLGEEKSSQDTSEDPEGKESETTEKTVSGETEIKCELRHAVFRLRRKDGKKLPAGVVLKVKPYSSQSGSSEYRDCHNMLEDMIQREGGAENSAHLRLYEIRLVSKTGEDIPAIEANVEMTYTNPITLKSDKETRSTVFILRDGAWSARFSGNSATNYGVTRSGDRVIKGFAADAGKVGCSDDRVFVGLSIFKEADPEEEDTEIVKVTKKVTKETDDTETDDTETDDTEAENTSTENTSTENTSTENTSTENTETDNTEAQRNTGNTENTSPANPQYLEGTETYKGKDFTVNVKVTKDAKIPEEAKLRVKEIEETKKYEKLAEKEKDVDDCSDARFYEIGFEVKGKEQELEAPVDVTFKIDEKVEGKVLSFEDGKAEEVDASFKVTEPKKEAEKSDADYRTDIKFETEKLTVYGIVGTTIEKSVLASDGHNYKISVTYGEDAGVPEGAELDVTEITKKDDEEDDEKRYAEYTEKTKETLGLTPEDFPYARFFDIKIVDQDGKKVKITAPVDVKIELTDKKSEKVSADNMQVVHFADKSETGDPVELSEKKLVKTEDKGLTVAFEASGFSVYAIVDLPESNTVTLDSIEENQAYKINFKVGNGQPTSAATYYLKGGIVTNVSGNSDRNGLDAGTYNGSFPNDAGNFYFERVEGTTDQFYIYKKDGVAKKYIRMTPVSGNAGRTGLTYAENAEDKTAFTFESGIGGRFHVSAIVNGKTYYWVRNTNQAGGVGAVIGYENKKDVNTAWLGLFSEDAASHDPYSLDGHTYSLLTWDGGKTGKAMSDTANDDNQGNLCAEFLTVMTKKQDAEDKLYVPVDTADMVTSWTFKWTGSNDLYKLSTKVDGRDRYLKIDNNGLSMVGENEAGDIQVIPGTGIHKGQLILKSGNNTLTYSGKYEKGYNINAGTGKEYLYLAEPRDESLLEDYYRTYTSTKISVSDPALSPSTPDAEPKKVIIYTRVWNGSGYTYFAVNGEGELVPCFERGDSIEWIGSTLDELQWEFTEYGSWNEDETKFTPNYYYELQNVYTGKYLAPLREGKEGKPEQILSDEPIGLNMSGRRNGQYYSPFMVWDTDNYSFTGINVDLEAGEGAVIEPCLGRDGLDFYFATVDELPVNDDMHTVTAVDNDQFGINMKLINFGSRKEMSNFLGNDTGGMTTKLVQGLLSSDLKDDGYPTVKSGASLNQLFKASNEVEANYLFTDSIYRATGYYEYDSSQNYAHLIVDDDDPWIGEQSPNGGNYKKGDFVVYQEIGSYDDSDKYTLKHGQFFPFNDLEPGVFADTNGRNLYKPTGEKLDETDPRFNEQLLLVKNVDCFFGTELTATFDQTPNGLDAWGHDIIFEFSGDDDFWLYVDGELVIDLGGIHSAVPGSVNFRTGQVNVNGTKTTLYQLFYDNYKSRGIPEGEITKILMGDPGNPSRYPGIFTETNGNLVFKDNTSHTMRIFYMERGAGASNLHMRFNLAAVKKGTVQLSKKLSNADDTEAGATAYPYQIWFKNPVDGEYEQLTEENIGGTSGGSVKLRGSINDIEYKHEYHIDHEKDGITYRAKYYDVFLLPAGKTAEITFPTFGTTGNEQFVTEYKVIECGVDPEVYQGVKVDDDPLEGAVKYTKIKVENGEEIELRDHVDSGLRDYAIVYSTLEARPRVTYENVVKETKTLRIQKELYKNENGQREQIVLYDAQGNPIDPDNPDLDRKFEFRLRLKAPNSDDDAWQNMVIHYHVKDPKGHYCVWDKALGKLVSTGKSNFDDLTEDETTVDGKIVLGEKSLATFESSESGSMSDIPAYYTVEVDNLLPGTEYQVVERPLETPVGFRFWKYKIGSKETEDGADPLDGIESRIKSDENSNKVLICNDKGYELLLKKIWSDDSTMLGREPSYFAVFCEIKDPSTGEISRRVLVGNSVRQLTHATKPQELNWWYLNLPEIHGLTNPTFLQFAVYEVKVTGSVTVDDQGEVSGYDSVEPVLNGGIVTLQGTPLGGSETPIVYRVNYDKPKTVGDNVREFKVTNTPSEIPSVKFLKEDQNGRPLAGASFRLKQEDALIFEKSSNSEGWISTEHLTQDKEYVLTETMTPQGYYGLQQPLTVRLISDAQSGWTLSVEPASADIKDYYTVGYEKDEATGLEYVTLTLKNRPYEFKAVKVDSTDHEVMIKGVVFELYTPRAVGAQTDWILVTWEDGKSELITDENGVIPHIDNKLPAGTYQLREKTPASGYSKASGSVEFTISKTGVITLGDHPENVDFSGPTEGSGETEGKLVYALSIPNDPLPLKLQKEDDAHKALNGAKFSLCIKDENNQWVVVKNPLHDYSDIDMTESAEFDLSLLPAGFYRLEETKAPESYVIMDQFHYFLINPDRTITLCDETGEAVSGNTWGEATLNENPDETGSYAIAIQNGSGAALPATGGPGIRIFGLLGTMLIALAGAWFMMKGRRQTVK